MKLIQKYQMFEITKLANKAKTLNRFAENLRIKSFSGYLDGQSTIKSIIQWSRCCLEMETK